MEGRERRAHLAMASCVLYCTPSTKGTGASRRGIMELGVTGIRRHCHLEGDAEVQGWLAALEGGRGAEKPGRALGKVADDLGHRVGSEHALAMAIRTSHLFIPRAVG